MNPSQQKSLIQNRGFLDSKIAVFYKAFFATLVIGIIGMAAFAAISVPSIVANPEQLSLTFFLGYLFAIPIFKVAGVVFRTIIRNQIFANAALGKHYFQSSVAIWPMLVIVLTNFIAIACSFGLLIPWAQVRMHKYLADNSAFLPNGSIEDFKGEVRADENAIGDACSDIEGVDLGLEI